MISSTYLHEMMVVMMVDHCMRMDCIVGWWVHRSSLRHKIIFRHHHLYFHHFHNFHFYNFTIITFTCEVDMA